ncbi:MAG: S8 family serine peptidase [Candidatus Zixiibacteriota bacterium]
MHSTEKWKLKVRPRPDTPRLLLKFTLPFSLYFCCAFLWAGLALSEERSEGNRIPTYPAGMQKIGLRTQMFLDTLPPDSTVAVWVFFKDKGIKSSAEYQTALHLTANQLSERSLRRRIKRGQSPELDFTDIPVKTEYLDELGKTGVKIRVVSKWLNAASVLGNKRQIEKIAELSFVGTLEKVGTFSRREPAVEEKQLKKMGKAQVGEALGYGASYAQLAQIHVPELHNLGYSGKGVLITMLDTGYWLHHPAFDSILNSGRLIAMHDFINNDDNVEDGADKQREHGTYTFSTVGGFANDTLIGPAYGADFALAKTEIATQEIQIEEDYWVAGAEWADSVGADVLSSSLGYNLWYTYPDMNGKTAKCTIAADLAISKGIVVVNAAGNERSCLISPCWNYIIAPADGDSVIAVGAVDLQGDLADFSSVGPTFDRRIKPDVVACGVLTYCASPYGGYTNVSGTSLSTPLVAGACALLLEIHPEWKPHDVINALHSTSSQADSPDTLMGYGIVNAAKASGFKYLAVSPAELSFEASLGDTQSQQKTLSLADWQGGRLKWNVSTTAQWITLLPNSGFTPDLLLVSVHPSGLKAGINQDSIVISSTDAVNSPQKVPVSLFLYPTTQVRVFPNPFTDSLTVIVEKPSPASKIKISVFTVAGELIDRFPKESDFGSTAGDGKTYEHTWDGRNENGNEVGSGIYLLKTEVDDNSTIVKVAKVK